MILLFLRNYCFVIKCTSSYILKELSSNSNVIKTLFQFNESFFSKRNFEMFCRSTTFTNDKNSIIQKCVFLICSNEICHVTKIEFDISRFFFMFCVFINNIFFCQAYIKYLTIVIFIDFCRLM